MTKSNEFIHQVLDGCMISMYKGGVSNDIVIEFVDGIDYSKESFSVIV